MTFQTGQTLTGSQMGSLVRAIQAKSSAGIPAANISATSYQDIPGTSQTFTLYGANSYIVVAQSVIPNVLSINSGQLMVLRAAWNGGTAQDADGQIIVSDKGGGVNNTLSKVSKVQLGAGTFTVTQQVTRTGSTFSADVTGSSILLMLFDIP